MGLEQRVLLLVRVRPVLSYITQCLLPGTLVTP